MATIQKAAANTLRVAARPTLSRKLPALARHETTTTPATTPDPPIPLAGIIGRGGGTETALTEAIRTHNPDYSVAIDYRTS